MNRKIVTCCLLAVMAGMASCKTSRLSHWETFKSEHAGEGFTVKVNGPLFKLGMGIASHSENDPETAALLKILSKLRGVEVRMIPLKHEKDRVEAARLGRMLEKDAYTSLVSIRDGNDNIHIWAKGKDDELRNPLVPINSGDNLLVVELKGSITADDIGALTSIGHSSFVSGHSYH